MFLVFLTYQMAACGQKSIIKQVEKFNMVVVNKLKHYANNGDDAYNLDNYNIRIIPSFYCSINDKLKEHYELDTSRFRIIGVSKDSKDTLILDSSKKGIIRSDGAESKFEFNIINKSNYCFYIYCVKKESGLYTLMGYFEDGGILFEDYRFNHYNNFADAIKYNWGSLEKVRDTEDIEKANEDFLANTSLNDAKNILRNSYSECYRLYPKDTLFVLDTYLNEIETKVSLFDGQRDYLRRLIQKSIKNEDHEISKNPEYDYFMNNMVSFEIFSTLTYSQYYEYKKNNNIVNQKISQARLILQKSCINHEINSPEKFDEFLKKEVFKK